MSIAALAITLALAGGGSETVQESSQAARGVYVCERDVASRRAFEREQRTEMTFVTADEALNSRERWSAPRCVTEREARKLESALAARELPQRRASRD